MRICKCGNGVPLKIRINGQLRNLQNRTQCLACLPFGTSPYREKDPEYERSRKAKNQKIYYEKFKKQHEQGYGPTTCRRKERKNWLLSLFNKSCQMCKYDKCSVNLSFHHLENKKLALDEAKFSYSAGKILKEVLKCVLVCHNCHGEIHQYLINEDRLNKAHDKLTKIITPYLGKSWAQILKTPGI
jgi:hypothetical protein